MDYVVEYTPEALANLEALTSSVQERVINKINWLAKNFDQLTPLPLTADLAGFYKLRVGDYRVVYEFDRESKRIFVDRIKHRREVYD